MPFNIYRAGGEVSCSNIAVDTCADASAAADVVGRDAVLLLVQLLCQLMQLLSVASMK